MLLKYDHAVVLQEINTEIQKSMEASSFFWNTAGVCGDETIVFFQVFPGYVVTSTMSFIFNQSWVQASALYINQFQPIVPFHIETINLICIANQMTGFYMKCNAGLKWINSSH